MMFEKLIHQLLIMTLPINILKKGKDYFSLLRLTDYKLIGQVFFVDFLFDTEDKLTGTVLGTPQSGALQKGSLEIEYRDLRDLLSQKYGDPVNTEKMDDGSETTIWNAETAEIRLNYTVSKILGASAIRLLYLMKQTDALERL